MQSVPQTRLRFEKKMIGLDPDDSTDEWEDAVDEDDAASGDGWASAGSAGASGVRAGVGSSSSAGGAVGSAGKGKWDKHREGERDRAEAGGKRKQ